MKNYSTLLLSQAGSILTILINRPAKLNALNNQTIRELNASLLDALGDISVRAIILTGSGEKAFVAGADIAEFQGLTAEQGEELSRFGHIHLFNLIENSPKPVLAAINGYALGGGLELAMACHLRIASTSAKMGLPELSLGLIPGYGGTQRLTQLVGKPKAMELILTGSSLTAEQALSAGLVNQVAEPAVLLSAAALLLEKITRKSPLAVAAAIRAINAAGAGLSERNGALAPGFETEIREFAKLFSTADFSEGVSAFLEKREARFTGE